MIISGGSEFKLALAPKHAINDSIRSAHLGNLTGLQAVVELYFLIAAALQL